VFCPPTYFSEIGLQCGVPSETTDAVREGGDAAIVHPFLGSIGGLLKDGILSITRIVAHKGISL
jgi:hypothetical protein